MKKQLIIMFIGLGLSFFFFSCEKDSICQTACEMEPIPDRTMIAKPGPVKYFFMKDTRQCQGVSTWERAPFATLQECEDCPCSRLVSETND